MVSKYWLSLLPFIVFVIVSNDGDPIISIVVITAKTTIAPVCTGPIIVNKYLKMLDIN